MSLEFGMNFCMGLPFSKDLSKVLLCDIHGKRDGFTVEMKSDDKSGEEVKLSQYIHKLSRIETEPKDWSSVVQICNSDQKWRTHVYCMILDDKFPDEEDLCYVIENTKTVSDSCYPSLKWLIPLALDATVLNTSFNQIIVT